MFLFERNIVIYLVLFRDVGVFLLIIIILKLILCGWVFWFNVFVEIIVLFFEIKNGRFGLLFVDVMKLNVLLFFRLLFLVVNCFINRFDGWFLGIVNVNSGFVNFGLLLFMFRMVMVIFVVDDFFGLFLLVVIILKLILEVFFLFVIKLVNMILNVGLILKGNCLVWEREYLILVFILMLKFKVDIFKILIFILLFL